MQDSPKPTHPVLDDVSDTADARPGLLHVVNIAFVIPYYLGGHIQHLNAKSYRSFVACSPSPQLWQYAGEMGFTAYPTEVRRTVSPLKDLQSITHLARYMRAHHIDTVVGHTPKGALIGTLAGRLAGVSQIIYVRHGLVFETQKSWRRKLLIGIDRLTSLASTHVVSVSPSVRDAAHRLHLNRTQKSVLLNRGTFNGIDTKEQFSPSRIDHNRVTIIRDSLGLKPTDIVIGYVGRLVNDKGIVELLQAWRIVNATECNAKLLLVGPYEERDGLPEDIRSWIDHDRNIVHTGYVADTQSYFALMNVFVLASRREGLPTVVLEASAMEIPVLTTRATGCRDAILDGVTGRFVDLNPIAIAKGIQGYLDDPNLSLQHGRNGRRFVQDVFDRDVIWQEFQQRFMQ